MNEIKNIYCPECLAKGKKKVLGKYVTGAKGTIYLWCKIHQKEMEIDLRAQEPKVR